jgi:hypothetical protein
MEGVSLPSLNEVTLTEGSKAWLREHLAAVQEQIIREARQVATSEGDQDILPKHVSQAAMRFAPGARYPDEHTWGQRILSSISGITIISALLALLFGILSIPRIGGPNSTGNVDIAKVFAGAIVGSAGAAVSTHLRRR